MCPHILSCPFRACPSSVSRILQHLRHHVVSFFVVSGPVSVAAPALRRTRWMSVRQPWCWWSSPAHHAHLSCRMVSTAYTWTPHLSTFMISLAVIALLTCPHSFILLLVFVQCSKINVSQGLFFFIFIACPVKVLIAYLHLVLAKVPISYIHLFLAKVLSSSTSAWFSLCP